MEFTATKNEKYNSYEILFDGKPAEQIRNFLKSNGYKWHKMRGVWYGYSDIADELRARTGEQSNEQETGEKTAKQGATDEQTRTPKTKPIKIYYNGVKIDGGKLEKIGLYFDDIGERVTLSAGILPRGYGFNIENDSDPYSDYFSDDYAEIKSDHPLYKFFKAAAIERESKKAARDIESKKRELKKYPYFNTPETLARVAEKEKEAAALAEQAKAANAGQPTAADLLAVDDYINEKAEQKKQAEEAAEQNRIKNIKLYDGFSASVIDGAIKKYPLTDEKNCVVVWWSENSKINKISEEQTGDGKISLAAADEIFARIDAYMHEHRETEEIGWYDKTKFSVIRDGETVETARIDLGDGDGGLHLFFIRAAKWAATHDENGKEKPEEIDDETADFLKWLGAGILAPQIAADEQAERQHAERTEQTEQPAKTGKTNAKAERAKALAEAFKKAKQAAKEHENDDDGGTCNFDSPTIYYKTTKTRPEDLRKSAELAADDVKKAAEIAGLSVWKWNLYGSPSFVISGCTSGQGNRRTHMAEAFSRSLRESGYGASVFYETD